MKSRLMKTAAPLLLGMSVFSAPAQSAFLLDNWTIDISTLGNQGASGDFSNAGAWTGIDGANFAALFSAAADIPDGSLDLGDTFTVDSLGEVQGLVGTGIVSNGSVPVTLGVNIELTFQAQTNHVVTGPGVPITVFGDLAGGTIDFFLDLTPDVNDSIDGTGGTGYVGGNEVLFASFQQQATLPISGEQNIATLDGSIDSIFALTANPFGALQNEEGNPLPVGFVIAKTDSNFDLDADGNTIPDTQFAAGGPLAGCPEIGSTTFNCGTENGSIVLHKVPEPGTLAIMGLGIVGMSLVRRRRKA